MENKKTEIGNYLGNGGDRIAYLRASDFKLGDEMRYRVVSYEEIDFGKDEHHKIKMMLILSEFAGEGEVGLVLNRTNLEFLVDQGYSSFDDILGKILTVKKQAQEVTYNQKGEQVTTETIGLFITSLEEDTNKQKKRTYGKKMS